MARISYGPQVKKRAKHLLEALLLYANDELDVDNEGVLDRLPCSRIAGMRSQIQTRWQANNRLVVRSKVRFLSALTELPADSIGLTATQVKEALNRLADFLEILSDNRPSRSGSENWHFTLHLWHPRYQIDANLNKFEQEWELRRHGKTVNQVGKVKAESTTLLSTPEDEYWQQLCRHSLEAQNQKQLTTNPLTKVDGISFTFDRVYLPLGLVERKYRDRTSHDVLPIHGSRLYESEEDDNPKIFTPDEFLQQLSSQSISQRIAILGEPGAGKTTLLQKIAGWLLDNTSYLPIWVSLADLQETSLEEYLIHDWLRNATRKRRITPELEDAFCEQFNQKRVWLLLDGVDEMAMESSQALTKIAKFLKGWIADATVILTCRLNVWDGGKNALESFTTYRNLNFTYGNNQLPDQVKLFINHWFADNWELADNLRSQLEQPGRRRIKDAVRNPLRLALMCRTWALAKGELPSTKAMLYAQFVEAIYQWKQDYFYTTISQQQQLNQALGELALQAIAQAKTRFRFSHGFICQVLGNSHEGMFQLALQLGWINQVGISPSQGEKVYAFYHPTFQEYFAALAINDWHFFWNSPQIPIFQPQWREVILLWLGRNDVPQLQKEDFIHSLISFEDGCGGFYNYQAYFLAALGIAEFADCSLSQQIIQQLIKWRFGYFHPTKKRWWRYPSTILEGARWALLRTDRATAIAALENFVQSSENEFEIWSAAYSLGKSFDPGNSIAITALEKLVTSLRLENVRWQAADSLGKLDPKNQVAITALKEMIITSRKDSIRRKSAYSLGKIEPGNVFAISTLETIITSNTSQQLRQQAAENLLVICAGNIIALQVLPQKTKSGQIRVNHKPKKNKQENKGRIITALVEGIALSHNDDSKRRRASTLAKYDPGNPIAFHTLLHLVKSATSDSIGKHTVEDLKKVLLDGQISEAIAFFKDCFSDEVTQEEMEDFRHVYKLLWHYAEQMNYADFYQIWQIRDNLNGKT
ncbi:NACHT domain-containing protein [Calothrix rhizosoleniae]|uniref:NACHT domain-containing protein n=1 Tax=Calothrix rhizosoleniae TaxID=888997 RepID=UPI000B499E39|nr:NACHT domain-containing protein [Calothrix rhizosoleniae]